MTRLAKILLTIAALQYGIVPPIVDLTESHVFHAAWPPHARFHMVWLLVITSLLAIQTLYLVWKPTKHAGTQLRFALVPGWIALVGFAIATTTRGFYGGMLADPEFAISIFEIDGNVFSFSIAACFQAVATGLVLSRTDDA